MGIYRYARNLFRYMAENVPPGYGLSLIANSLNQEDFTRNLGTTAQFNLQTHPVDSMSALRKLRWELFGSYSLCKALKPDIYFNPKGFAPGLAFPRSQRYKIALTVHDLIPFWYLRNSPSTGSRLERRYICLALSRSISRSDQIIAISQSTAHQISTLVPTARIDVVYNGVEFLQPRTDERILSEPFFFSLSSSLPHKNLKNLVAGYSLYRCRHTNALPLYICGVKNIQQPGIYCLNKLDDYDLARYYRDSQAFIFLSEIEGFGYPPLEAHAQGTPLVVSDIEAHREVLGDNAFYVSPLDPESIAQGFAKYHSVNAHSAHHPNPLQHASFQWPKCAEQTWRSLSSLMKA